MICRIYLFSKMQLFFMIFWMLLEYYISMEGSINFIKSTFYATTKSWHAHQKIRLDELIWKKWVLFVFIRTFIELSTKPFENLLLWHCLKTAYVFLFFQVQPVFPKDPWYDFASRICTDCPLRDWYDWLIRGWLVDKGCITQLNRLCDLDNKLGDLPPKISQT